MATVTQRAPSPEPRVPALLAQQWYWYYVLGLLTLCYVANVADRSQVLAASLQAIKREFNATDAQLGILSGLPFAIFYSFLGIPLAAWADRSSRRNVLALVVCAVERGDRRVRPGAELRDAVRRARRPRPSAKRAAARRRTRSSPTTSRS